jgi:hypothetical protein
MQSFGILNLIQKVKFLPVFQSVNLQNLAKCGHEDGHQFEYQSAAVWKSWQIKKMPGPNCQSPPPLKRRPLAGLTCACQLLGHAPVAREPLRSSATYAAPCALSLRAWLQWRNSLLLRPILAPSCCFHSAAVDCLPRSWGPPLHQPSTPHHRPHLHLPEHHCGLGYLSSLADTLPSDPHRSATFRRAHHHCDTTPVSLPSSKSPNWVPHLAMSI